MGPLIKITEMNPRPCQAIQWQTAHAGSMLTGSELVGIVSESW